ncbi:MAG: hypothetical protein Q8K00_02435 [Syntrophales bacterium]|nr:hypothetical protein [Syntrophales bacterium]
MVSYRPFYAHQGLCNLISRVSGSADDFSDLLQAFLYFCKKFFLPHGSKRRSTRLLISYLPELFSGTMNSEIFLIEELSDQQQFLYILSPVESLIGSGADRSDSLEFGFPVSDDIRLNIQKPADFADPEITLIWNRPIHNQIPTTCMRSLSDRVPGVSFTALIQFKRLPISR